MVALFVTGAGHLTSLHLLVNPGGIGMCGTETMEVVMGRTMVIGMEQKVGPVHILREEELTRIGLRNG